MKEERVWLKVNWSDMYGGATATESPEPKANGVGSKLQGQPPRNYGDPTVLHAPCLDLDLPAQLFPSSTEGHFHLYIDKIMTWKDYQKLLKVLAEVGIIEEGYYKASVEQGQTILRRQGEYKTPEAAHRALKEKIEREGLFSDL